MVTSSEPSFEGNGTKTPSLPRCHTKFHISTKREISELCILSTLESYFKGNSIVKDVKKRALLMLALGSRAIDVLSGRWAPRKFKELTYAHAIEILVKFYAPRPNKIAEGFKLFTTVQNEDESSQQFIVELRLHDKWEFGGRLDRILRNKIVCGI